MKADGYKQIVKELRFAAEYGCDSDLTERAADALEEAADQIERGASEKSGKTVYVKMLAWAQWNEIQALEKALNNNSPDKIVVLPSYVDIMNPEELEAIMTKEIGE